jgi:predicted phage-related endonuclease
MNTLRRIEAENVIDRLNHFKQNKTKTADSLKISYRGLNYKLKRIENEYPDLFEKVKKYEQVIKIIPESELSWKMPTCEERIEYLDNPTYREC